MIQQYPKDDSIQSCSTLCASSHPATVFMQHGISGMVTAVFNPPVTSPNILSLSCRQQHAADGIPYFHSPLAISACHSVLTSYQCLYIRQRCPNCFGNIGQDRCASFPNFAVSMFYVNDDIFRWI
ncbi:hypothetical protein WDJ50_06850 [Deinococcus sp. VB142]|uniref:Uncharacterized protein n=1 Tax=Deinococcus sp. VB142 TaxID=3112952 RepID=A0AAU6Q5E4_9DEIO